LTCLIVGKVTRGLRDPDHRWIDLVECQRLSRLNITGKRAGSQADHRNLSLGVGTLPCCKRLPDWP
jgi:hypothetical protein